MAKGARKVCLLAAAVAGMALLQAGTAFVAGRQPPMGAAPFGPGVKYAPKAVGGPTLVQERTAGNLVWSLSCVALLCASGARLAVRSSASKVERRCIRVSCSPLAAPVQAESRLASAAPPTAPAPAVTALIDLEAAPAAQVVSLDNMLDSAVPQVAEPVAQPEEETSAPWAFPSRVGAARFVGGTRYSQCHGHSSSFFSSRAARRAVGAKLQEHPVAEVREMSFDPSQLRVQIQVGLCAGSLVRAVRGHESKGQSASKCAVATSDARIKEDDCLEEYRLRISRT